MSIWVDSAVSNGLPVSYQLLNSREAYYFRFTYAINLLNTPLNKNNTWLFYIQDPFSDIFVSLANSGQNLLSTELGRSNNEVLLYTSLNLNTPNLAKLNSTCLEFGTLPVSQVSFINANNFYNYWTPLSMVTRFIRVLGTWTQFYPGFVTYGPAPKPNITATTMTSTRRKN